MTDLLAATEAIPATYPTAPTGLSADASALDADMVWQRIESYVRHRWTDRQVTWTIEGAEGANWSPPLGPVTSLSAEKWEAGAWMSISLTAGPLGYWLPSDGTFKATAQVGSGTPPAGVLEAFRRLAEYMADDSGTHAGASSEKTAIGPVDMQVTRNAAWMARAMQNSGAADLLRPYRRRVQ